MADYKKYAENLIGNWERDIYAPQAQVRKDVYQTNWNALTNNYNTLKDKLARNFELAQEEYANKLNNTQNTSFNRMNAANIDLANRGLSSSGVTNKIEQADTQIKGQEVDKALANLLATNNASAEGLYQGLNALGQGQSNLAADVAGDLGKLTDAEAANAQQYANLLGGIGEGAAQRAAARAASGGGRSKKQEEEIDAIERRLAAYYVLNDNTLSDDDKRDQLVSIGIPVGDALNAISSVNYTKYQDETAKRRNKLESRISDLQGRIANATTPTVTVANVPSLESLPSRANVGLPLSDNFLDVSPRGSVNSTISPGVTTNSRLQNSLDNYLAKLDRLNKGNAYTYADLWDALYGNIR